METVRSSDGTLIAVERGGTGPPLLLVHGALGGARTWWPVLAALQQRFTVYAVDRRGRGASGDTLPHSLQREVEDIIAVLDWIGEPADLLGHSYGAICTLEAALAGASVHRLVLYEPPTQVNENRYAADLANRLQQALDAGNRDAVVATFLRDAARASPAAIERLRATPAWPSLLALASTVPREERAVHAYAFVPERCRALQLPALILQGSESPAHLVDAARAVASALPNGRLAVLEGQGHTAMTTAPALFAREVLAFLVESG